MDTLPPEKKDGKFFTFPLPLLYPMEPHTKTLSRILSYCVLTVGESSLANLPEETADGILSRAASPDDFDDAEETHRHVVLGCDRLNVKVGTIRGVLAEVKDAREIVHGAERINGASPLVFVGAKLFWECYNGELPYRDFTVLCAVNSVIGMKTTPQLIRRTLLLARAAGFKTPATYSKGCMKGFKARPMMTVDELRWTLDKLEKRELFARAQASPRRVYFSKGPREKLLADVAVIVAKQSSTKIADRRKDEREAMRKARENGTK